MTDNSNVPENPIGSELVKEDPSFADIVVQFVEGLSDRVRVMDEAIRAADFEALRTAAHQLKGSGGGYGYPVLTQTAAELEKCAKSQALDECLQAFDELRGVAQRVVVDEENP